MNVNESRNVRTQLRDALVEVEVNHGDERVRHNPRIPA